MQIISVINYKGGVGKTTLTANLAAELAFRGKRVLLLDMDAQCSLTFSFVTPDYWRDKLGGDDTAGSDKTIKSWFDGVGDDDLETPKLGDLIVPYLKVTRSLGNKGGKIDLIPSHLGANQRRPRLGLYAERRPSGLEWIVSSPRSMGCCGPISAST